MNHYKEQKDEMLVDLTLLGNDGAYEELVKRYGKLAQSVAYGITGNRFSAEDATQDAFVSAWMKLDTLREREKFSSWICKIAGNAARNVMFHYKNAIPDLSLDLISYCEFDGSDDPEISLIADSEGEELREALDSLTEKLRETIKLHYFDGYSVKEIAEMLSLPAGTVKWRLCEGRKQLRKGYGIMEKSEYNENEDLVTRVLRQVNELKKWRRKNDKSGFESDYRKVLEAVNALSDCREKDFALADVLLLGYWFLPGEKNDETLKRIKEAAEASHNDEVMQDVLANENDKRYGDDLLNFMREKIDYLRCEGYRLALGYEIFWYARNLLEGNYEEALEQFRNVLEVLEPSDAYYAAALAALKAEKLRGGPILEWDETLGTSVTSEQFEKSGDKLYCSGQPGYSGVDYPDALFQYLGVCDSIILDGELKAGASFVSSDGKLTYTVKREKETVTVPAGTFTECTVIEIKGVYYNCSMFSETWLSPGVGIVKETIRHWNDSEWVLSEFSCEEDSADLIPLSVGNRWKYSLINRDELYTDNENVYEVVFADEKRITMSHYTYIKVTGYDKSTVNGNIAFIRHHYFNDGDKPVNRDEIFASLELMDKAAKTDFEKKYAKACTEVTKRIFDTNPGTNPDYTEKGIWNHFGTYEVNSKEVGKLKLSYPVGYHIEWKDTETMDFDGSKLCHAFLLDIWKKAAGDCIWNDRFAPGFEEKKDEEIFGTSIHRELEVKDDETVTTSAGNFENCRHIHVQLDGLSGGQAYQGGNMDFWFAPGVGLVRYSRATDRDRDNVFELTKYEGVGEGYFPVNCGLFRRYEPTDLQGGWHSSVEHTYGENDGKIQIIYNILGTLDRKEYEEAMKRMGKPI